MAFGVDDALALAGSAMSGLSVSDITGGWSGYSSGQSMTKYAAEKSNWLSEQAYQRQMRAYLEAPANIRKGLEAAGINPLLATSAFGNASAGSGGSVGWSGSDAGVGVDGDKALTFKDRKEMLSAQKKTAVADSEATEEEAVARKKEAHVRVQEALADEEIASARHAAVVGWEPGVASPMWHKIKDTFRKQFEAENYQSSPWRNYKDDALQILNAILGGASSASSAFRSVKRANRAW